MLGGILLEGSYLESEMNQKIPIKITWIENQEGISEPEVVIDAEDYFDFEGSITDALIKFKKEYSNLLKKTASLKEDPKKTGQMKKIWQLGKELAKFNERVKNQFIILNQREAFSRDLGISERYIRFFMNFSKYFSLYEVINELPYGHYRIFCDNADQLKKSNLFKKEKKLLFTNFKSGKLLPREEYRLYLNKITSQTIAE